ncbi:MAG TPA: hypothetical protein VFZ80_01100, partial [Acidimicrobiia bacterium]
ARAPDWTTRRSWRRLDTGDSAGIDCPVCGGVMKAPHVDGVMLDGCPVHDVVWFAGPRSPDSAPGCSRRRAIG